MEMFLIFILLFIGFILMNSIKILSEWEKGVVLRLGRSIGARGPGLVFVIPLVDRIYRVDLRTVTMDVPSQDVITRDNISLKVNAVVYFRVVSAEAAISKVADFYFATSQLAQTTLRSVLGQFQMDEILEQRDKINHRLQELIDNQTEPWGVKVTLVEVKNIDLPKEMQSAMARQAEAERERRAKVISAQGELQRSEILADASTKLAVSPNAIQLAYLQTLSDMAAKEGTRTIVFPVPIDLLKGLLNR